jgi:hypothetical protein
MKTISDKLQFVVLPVTGSFRASAANSGLSDNFEERLWRSKAILRTGRPKISALI